MNHCVLEVQVKQAPTLRYTQDKKIPIAEMEVIFESLKADDPPSEMKVVGWGNMAQDLQNQVKTGQKLILEGRLRMNTVPRQDGTKEKRAELTVSKVHQSSGPTPTESSESTYKSSNPIANPSQGNQTEELSSTSSPLKINEEGSDWNSSPLVPDTDDIPF